MERKVVVQGGGANLFKVSGSEGVYYVYHVKVNPFPFSDDYKLIGKTGSFEDALTLIRSYSGREIKVIRDW